MSTAQTKTHIGNEFDVLLHSVAQLETREIEQFLSQVSVLLAQRKAPNLNKRESELLQAINRSLPETLQERYSELRHKLDNYSITSTEQEEFTRIVDQIELADAERLGHLIELAQLRNVSLDSLLEQLGIHAPAVHG